MTGMASRDAESSPLFCDHCQAVLEPGSGKFYVVRIEALCDPTPPVFTEEDLRRDPKEEMQRIVEDLRGVSEQEAIDQVHRRLTLFLCGPCYREWIENPTG